MKPYQGPYAFSKAVLEGLARAYAAETTKIGSKVMMPGYAPRCARNAGRSPITLKPPEESVAKALPPHRAR